MITSNANHHLVDVIEQANDREPFCACGRPTEPVYRDGIVWLECSSLREPREGRLARLSALVAPIAHVRRRIVEVGEPGDALVGAA